MLLRDLFDEIPTFGADPSASEASRRYERLLDESLDVFADWSRAEHLLLSAQAQRPDQLEFSVALYKMYAYSNRFHEAINLIDHVLTLTSHQCQFPANPRHLERAMAHWQPAQGAARKYLYALKAKAFVLLRKQDLTGAQRVLEQLDLVDPLDQVGGSVVRAMAERVLEQGELGPN